jgi:molybdopterin-binding protein
MKLSARNVLKGKIKSVEIGPVNAELTIEVAPGFSITSIITKKSCEDLKLKVGKKAYAVIKASSVMVATD